MSNYPELPEPSYPAGCFGAVFVDAWDKEQVIAAIDADRTMRADWVKTSERMPAEDEQVWAWLAWPDGTAGNCYAIWTGNDWFLDLTECGDLYFRRKAIMDGMTVAEVTHWHSLPQPPEA